MTAFVMNCGASLTTYKNASVPRAGCVGFFLGGGACVVFWAVFRSVGEYGPLSLEDGQFCVFCGLCSHSLQSGLNTSTP